MFGERTQSGVTHRINGNSSSFFNGAIYARDSEIRISVQFPYRLTVPMMRERELILRIETLAPMVSPTQS